MKQRLSIVLGLALFFFSTEAIAQDMTLAGVVQAVLRHQPKLDISRTDAAIAAADERRIEGLLDPSLKVTAGGSNEQVPVISDFQAAETRKLQLGGSITQPLKNGDSLAVAANYSRSGQGFNSPLAAQLARFNPSYRSQIDVTWRHALLRGRDRPNYALGLQSVENKSQAAELDTLATARTLALSALNAFFRLAADDINVGIAEQAVARARDVLRYQKSRQSFGLIEKADALQAEALLAARNTDLQRARSTRKSDEHALKRLMTDDSASPVALQLPPDDERQSLPDFDTAESHALERRPDVRAIDARLAAAEADLTTAQAMDDPQLDMVAQLGTRALDANASTAAAKGFSVRDRYASLSLEMQDSVGRNAARAAVHKAELARLRLTDQRRAAIEQVRDDIDAAITGIVTGLPNLRAARLQAVAEKKKYLAELARYREGRSDTATLVQFEGDLRNAELQQSMQALSLQLARYQLAWAEGSLFDRLGIDLADIDPATITQARP